MLYRAAMRITDQEANRLKVLKAIRRAEPVARTELVRLTGLASGSITEIVGDLVRRKALLEAKSPAVGRGRPRLQLYLNPEAGLVVGAFLLPTSDLSVEISNARGDRLYERTTAMSRAPTIRAWAEQIGEAINEVIETSPLARSRIRRVGLALPALVESSGLVHWLQTYPQESVDVGAIVEARVGLPVTVDNSVNVMARAEHWFGEDRQVDDFSLVAVGHGLGLAEYVDGVLKTGAHGINSEFSHTKIALDDEVACTCGGRGCLATYATGYGVVVRAYAARGLPRPRLRDIDATFRQLVQDARAGDPTAAGAFELAGRALGVAVANLINMSDPARVLVLVLDQALADLIAAPFHASLQENILPALRGRTPVQLKVAEEARFSHGAAALVLEQLYRATSEPRPAVPVG
jgi:predicted NBD/HSP70 family sugar kinase